MEAGKSKENKKEEKYEEERDDMAEERSGDLPGATYTTVDRMMDEVYGDHVPIKMMVHIWMVELRMMLSGKATGDN